MDEPNFPPPNRVTASPSAVRGLVDEIMRLRAALRQIAESSGSPMRSIPAAQAAEAALADDSESD